MSAACIVITMLQAAMEVQGVTTQHHNTCYLSTRRQDGEIPVCLAAELEWHRHVT